MLNMNLNDTQIANLIHQFIYKFLNMVKLYLADEN